MGTKEGGETLWLVLLPVPGNEREREEISEGDIECGGEGGHVWSIAAIARYCV